MLTVKGQNQGELLEIVTEGTATKEDLEKYKEALKAKILQEEPIHILFIFKNIEGVTFQGFLEDMKTLPLMKSVGKGAVVEDGTLTHGDLMIGKLFPGVDVAHFSMDEMEEARDWLKR
ncbi:STAS/SEC14 domain-containing protein [Aciduricibacillus chroicocephali]|uniref:STAS/SEC14 domain-containing protein n=1 Tax=Aciduricibacillus chroicocephali TaxID=3054939 RepID=A0ABY9KUI1_9BACI|nr:STAS/SEC14 domain-containing protein [Bacillaceae bacterium 44XB]